MPFLRLFSDSVSMENNKNDVLPPYPNRGVQNTLQSGLRACVDWLQVTFKNIKNLQEIFDVLGLDSEDFIEFENGKYGYHSHVRFGHIAIYYSSNKSPFTK